MEKQLIYFLDLFGTYVFAISGLNTASRKQFDMFGASVIAFITAVGGGTIRDVLIGSQPVGWMTDLNYLIAVALGIITGYVFKNPLLKIPKTLFLFDTIGIGLFTILGMQKTLNLNLAPVIAITMGTTSAVFGGVIRDVLCNRVPLIFRKEIYATACIAGAFIYLLLTEVIPNSYAIIATVIFIILFRTFSIIKKWSLPKF